MRNFHGKGDEKKENDSWNFFLRSTFHDFSGEKTRRTRHGSLGNRKTVISFSFFRDIFRETTSGAAKKKEQRLFMSAHCIIVIVIIVMCCKKANS